MTVTTPDDLDLDDLDPDLDPGEEESDDLVQDEGDLDAEELEVTDRSAPVLEPTPGCAVSFFVDNKRHHGICLAVLGDELLIEHKGATRCSLFICKVKEIIPRLRAGVASATIVVGDLKPYRYRSTPRKWLWQMITTKQTWKGIERGGGVAPSPADLLRGNDQMELF